MLLLHAIAPAEDPVASLAGLRARPLRRLAEGRLAAYATLFEDVPTDLGRADLLANHELVSRLGECLPARFPTWFEEDADVGAYLRSHAADLWDRLGRLRGLCELAVTVVWTGSAPPTPEPPRADPPGRRYLLERRRELGVAEDRRKRAVELRALVQRTAGDRLVAAEHRVWPSQAVALSSALLIPRSVAVEIRERLVARLGSQHDVRILVNGPWPPYTFAGG